MTKVTEDITLVEDKDDHIKRCPGCWRQLGQNHLEECITLRRQQVQASKEMSPWLEETLRVQATHRRQRKPRVRILCPDPVAVTPARVGGSGIGKVSDAVSSVYQAVKDRFPGRRLQTIIQGDEKCIGMHFRDIPGKRIPLNGQMMFRIQERSKNLVSTMVVTFENRHVVQVDFQAPQS